MSIRLINHYIDRGYTKPFAIRLAQKRVIEATRSLSKVSDDVIARRLLEQNIWGVRK